MNDDELNEMMITARDAIEVPASGFSSIVAAERAARPAEPQVRTNVPRWRRIPVMAAAAVSLAVGVIGATTWETAPTLPSASSAQNSLTSPGLGLPGGFNNDSGAVALNGYSVPGKSSASPASGSAGSSTSSASLTARIESSGSESITVARGDVAAALTSLAHLAARSGGFVATTKYVAGRAGGEAATGTITLQVPVASFATLVTEVGHVGHSVNVTTTSTDVTGEYVDLQSQIQALQASRTQYLAILRKATSIPDILKVEAQITALQGQIQQLEGQLYVLTNATTYGALLVAVSVTGAPIHATPGHESGVIRAVHDSVHGFVTAFEGLIKVVGPALFVALCLAALALVWRSGRRAWRRRLI
jgi:hypothetical protein